MNQPSDVKEILYKVKYPLAAFTDQGAHTCQFKLAPDFLNTGIEGISSSAVVNAYVPAIPPEQLGDSTFLRRHGLRYPYVAGAMANGITSSQMVIEMGRGGMIGFFGAGGLALDVIEKNILEIKNSLGSQPFGFNLIHSLDDPEHEMATVKLYLEHGVNRVSAAAFMRMTHALVFYRVKGIYQNADGRIIVPNHVIAKVSRIEVARQFFSPPPEKIVNALFDQGLISEQEALMSRHIPMAWDLTAEADSGGHTDNRPALTLLPTMRALKDEFETRYNYGEPLCVGLGGGIATPESTAAAFQMGAAYVLTGSINQSCVEAGISRGVKDLLAQAQQADVTMAPSADMFEIGAKVQVLKRGTMFPVRAEKLYQIYRNYRRFEDVPADLKQQIEDKFLQSGFEQKWEDTRRFFESRNQHKEIERALSDPSHKMALVFRSYLGLSSRWAIDGDPGRQMDYQIWCGPAIGAFNQWVKGTFLENQENRHVVEVGLNLLLGACVSIRQAFLRNQGVSVPDHQAGIVPLRLGEINTYIH